MVMEALRSEAEGFQLFVPKVSVPSEYAVLSTINREVKYSTFLSLMKVVTCG